MWLSWGRSASHRVVISVALFHSARALAFHPTAEGAYASSAISSTISFVDWHSNISQQYNYGTFSLLGLEFKQTFGWKQRIALEVWGSGALSVGGAGVEGRLNGPARMHSFDLGTMLFPSIALDKKRTVFIEPAIGISCLKGVMKTPHSSINSQGMEPWTNILFWGPQAGFFMRMMPVERFTMRMGGFYMASQLRSKDHNENGMALPIEKLKARRHGLGAALALNYQVRPWVSLGAKIDYQTWQSGGSVNEANVDSKNPYLRRIRLSWGAQFSY